MADVLVVTSRVKKLAKKSELRAGADFIEALSDLVKGLVVGAAAKAKADKRGTLKSRDLELEGE